MPGGNIRRGRLDKLHSMPGREILSVRSIRAAYLSGGICARFHQDVLCYMRSGHLCRGRGDGMQAVSGGNISAEYNGGQPEQLQAVPGGYYIKCGSFCLY
ncbi:MAG: hypothetical protein LBO78_03115 [Rickettsiales bacterium]|nr:hypothetical protein [Rickettsiales bacterium]